MKFDFDWPCGFGGQDVQRVWTTDGQMTHDGGIPILDVHQ